MRVTVDPTKRVQLELLFYETVFTDHPSVLIRPTQGYDSAPVNSLTTSTEI